MASSPESPPAGSAAAAFPHAASLPGYAELHCLSNFSFLRGASQPEELVEQAAALGYSALALTDECSLAGVVRAHVAMKEREKEKEKEEKEKEAEKKKEKNKPLQLIIGTEIKLEDGMKLVLLATDRHSYGRISALITTGRRRSKKGAYSLSWDDLEPLGGTGVLVLWIPNPDLKKEQGLRLKARFNGNASIAAELHLGPNDRARLECLKKLSAESGLPLVAAGDAHMHRRSRRRLQDALTAVRLGRPVAQCGHALFPNGERCLRQPVRLAPIYPPELLAEA